MFAFLGFFLVWAWGFGIFLVLGFWGLVCGGLRVYNDVFVLI